MASEDFSGFGAGAKEFFAELGRQAVNEDKRGSQLERSLADLDAAGLSLMEEPSYKRAPRGYDKEHPRV
jgi:hypothetical protein